MKIIVKSLQTSVSAENSKGQLSIKVKVVGIGSERQDITDLLESVASKLENEVKNSIQTREEEVEVVIKTLPPTITSS